MRANSARLNARVCSVGDAAPTSNADAKSAPVTLTFEYQDAAGLHARKQLRIEPNSYVVTMTTQVTDAGKPVNPYIQWGPALGDVIATGGGSMFMALRKSEAIYSIDDDVERVQAANLLTTPRHQGTYEFAGVDTHYFISAAVKPERSRYSSVAHENGPTLPCRAIRRLRIRVGPEMVRRRREL